MLQISLNDTLLDLDAATSITMVAVNPIFDLENIQRVFSYPFRLPVTPHNAEVFQHVQLMNVEGTRKYTGAKLYSNGIFLQQGVILVLGRTADYIEIAFQNDQIDWIENLKKLRLRDLNWPVIVPGADYFPILRFFYTEATSEESLQRYVFQINDNLYDQPTTPDQLNDAINEDYPGLSSLNFVPASDSFYLLIDTSQAPADFLINLQPTVVQDPATEYFYPQYQPDPSSTGGEEAVRDAWLDHLANTLVFPIYQVYPTVHATKLYNDKNPAFEGYVNEYDPVSGEYLHNEIDTTALIPGEKWQDRGWARTVIPMPFLYETLRKVFSTIGISAIDGDFSADLDLRKLVLFNNRTLDRILRQIDFFANPQYFVDVVPPYNGFVGRYNLADHLPDMTAYDFIIALSAGVFGLTFELKQGRMYIHTIANLLGQKEMDWTDLFASDYQIAPREYDAYDLDFDRQGDDSILEDQLTRIAPPEDAEKPLRIVSRFFSLYNETDIYASQNWQLPYYIREGTSEPYQTARDVPRMLLFYYGLQGNSEGNTYPLASHHNTNFDGEKIGPYSLNWHGEDGRYEVFWKEYIRLRQNGETITRRANLGIADFLLWLDNPARPIYARHHMGNIQGVIRQITIQFGMNGPGIAQVQIQKLP